MNAPALTAARDRLPFLDVLRGVAAAAVVVEHGLAVCIPGYLDFSSRYFELGQFGVTLFLLISGFIIPVTLERGRSNGRFWVNRLFRLFPLYWATIGFFALYYLVWSPEALYPPELWQWLANLTMLQEFFRAPHVTSVFWTLTLELMFYAACSLLYNLGAFRWTAWLVWAGQAGLLLVGVAYPLLAQRRFPGGYAMLFLSMFVGTALHRYSIGRLSRRQLQWLLACLALVSLAVSYVCFERFTRTGLPLSFHCVWCTWLAAYAGFLILLPWRGHEMPAWLCYLGKISYSIYLVHTCLVVLLPSTWPPMLYIPALFAGTLVLASLTFHLIEQPFIRLGRRWTGRRASAPEPLPAAAVPLPRKVA
jgi:peptidoglycan/LPS O-acetylase OafA/YrhL